MEAKLLKQQSARSVDKAIQRAQEDFNAHGYMDHFTSQIGGCHPLETVIQQLKTTCRMLVATINLLCVNEKKRLAKNYSEFCLWLHAIIVNKTARDLFVEYVKSIHVTAAASSVNVYLSYYVKSARWYVDFVAKEDIQRKMDKFERLLKNLRCGIKRSISIQLQQKDNSIDAAIRNGKYPPGGLKQLQLAVLGQIPHAIEIADLLKDNKTIISSVLYSTFMSILYCGIYVFAPNGRVGGK